MNFEEPKPSSGQLNSGEVDEMVNSEIVRLRQILPEEVWILVANQLQKKSSNGVENLANSSVFFQNLLASQRTNYLFEKVFPLVAASIWKKEGLEGLPVSDVLKLRKVSKVWNAAIDKLIPEKLLHFGEGSVDLKSAHIRYKFRSIVEHNRLNNYVREFDNGDGSPVRPNRNSVLNFLSHFDKTHPINQSNSRNPWIWGKIAVIIYDAELEEDSHVFVEGMSTMLTKYGGHLYSFSLDNGNPNYREFFENSALLQKWLSEMPNLKEFTFNYSRYLNIYGANYAALNLEQAFNDCPFPKLKFLEKLKAEDLPMPMFNQLIRQNNHISTLSITHSVRDRYDNYDVFTFAIPNLKKFEMLGCPGDIVKKLGNSKVQWKLETLRLVFYNRFRCAALLKVIQKKFANTLVDLSIEQDYWSGKDDKLWQDCKSCRLDLPKLRKIRVDLNQCPVCLDFLLPMKNSLEKITASFGYRYLHPLEIKKTYGANIQFVGFEEKMLESNIWANFINLQKMEGISIRRDQSWKSIYYSREDWMLNSLSD